MKSHANRCKNRALSSILIRIMDKNSAHISAVCLCIFTSVALAESNQNLTDIPLEELLAKEVVTASKIAQQLSNSPSAVSIVTARDIKSYGYRTLAEVINSMRGLNTVSDHVYTYMSGRGFGNPGDYAGRVMLLIDGQQANDNLYNSSYLANDGLLDTELIDRVEYVSGPGGVTYGNGAFYGIINVITKKGSDFNSAQVAIDGASYQSYKKRITYGNKLENGADVLISASDYQSHGQNFFFKEFDSPATNFGMVNNLDQEKNRRLFFKGSYQQWSLETAYVTRKKDDPAASYGADFNTSPSFMQDGSGYTTLRYEGDISDTLKSAIKTYYGQYNYRAAAIYGGQLLKEKDTGRWWGTEAKFVYSGLDKHQLVYGLEYRSDYQQDFYLYTGKIKNSAYMASAYLQDEYRWSNLWTFNLGMRGDYGGNNTSSISPRLAAIYSPIDALDIKASYSTAFRRPNVYEKYYTDYATQLTNPNLKQEVVYASELVVEYRPDKTSKLMSSLFDYTTKNLIEADILSSPAGATQYVNEADHQTKGVDIEYDKQWSIFSRLRASYAWQYATGEAGNWIANSPKNLAKLNVSHGFFNQYLQSGFEVQYVGRRLSNAGNQLGGYSIANLTLYSDSLMKNTSISTSIKNLFDRHYSTPAPTFYRPDSFSQDGRTFWLQLSHDFK